MGAAFVGTTTKHNTYRATHQVGALAWDDALASSSATWANNCDFNHDPNVQVGENI